MVFADEPVRGSELAVATSNPPPNPEGRRSLVTPVKLTLSGDDLGAGATLEFPIPKDLRSSADSAAVGVATYDEASRQWVPVTAAVDPSRGLVTARTTHFSWWQPWTWDWPGMGATVNQAVGQLIGKRADQAGCTAAEGQPGWVAALVGVSNDPALAVRACAQGQNGILDVQLVNNRPYGMVLRYGSAVKWGWHEDGATPLEAARNKLMDALLAGGKGLYLPPLGRASVGVSPIDGGRYVTFPVSVSGATLAADLISVVAGELVTAAGGRLAEPLKNACASYLSETVAAETLGSPTSLHEKMISAGECVEKAFLDAVSYGWLDKPSVQKLSATLGAIRNASLVGRLLTAYDTEWRLLDLYTDTRLVPAVPGLDYGFGVRAKASEPEPEPAADTTAGADADSSAGTAPEPSAPPAAPAPAPVPAPAPAPRGLHIEDVFYGGTWARAEPDDGTWHSRGSVPANGRYWFANGLGVAVDCTRQAASYPVRFADGRRETWSNWGHVTDGTWVPVATFQEINTDGDLGLPRC